MATICMSRVFSLDKAIKIYFINPSSNALWDMRKRPAMTTKTTTNTEDAVSFPAGQSATISMRIPAEQAYLLQFYADRMNSSTGKILNSILEDVLPTFKKGVPPQVTIRIPQVFHAMENADLLYPVNTHDLRERILSRGPAAKEK